ncbi:MAG: DNRLRE domain-containing protein [archaeon]
MEKKEKITITLGLFCLFAFVFFILFFTQISQEITGYTFYDSQPDATAGEDTYIREDFPNNNFPTATVLSIGKTAGDSEFRALLKFNLSSIPSTDTIVDAVIQIYLESASGNANVTVKAYRLTSEWIEAEASWNDRITSTAWSSTGGDYDSSEIDTQIFSNSSGNYYNFTITEAVAGWTSESYNNYGIILVSSNTFAGNYSQISSSDSATASQRPQIIVEHTPNAIPTINDISTNTNTTSPKEIGEDVTFTIDWTDLESDDTQTHVCNSSDISFSEGCADKTFCSTSLASTNPTTCSYTILSSDNTTTSFCVAVCDANNCSTTSSENYFYMNHPPVINITQPNGGETVNQSQGNYSITFEVSDSDSNALTAIIYYGESQNSTTNTIASNINLTNYCTDGDSDTATTNDCTYSWNSLGIYGTYYLTIILNDSLSNTTDSSDSSFDVRSIIDTDSPQITNVQIDSGITSGEQTTISATITDDNIDTAWISFNYTSTNVTMSNTTATSFNASFIAPAVGTYKFKIYAEDKVEQINDSLSWQEFSVAKPNVTTQNETAPSTALPYHTIKVTSQLNATDPLRNVYAYLTIPDGFTFLSDYPQNTPMENFTAGQTKTATWFLSVPISEATYTLNVTYTDGYSNSWNSSDMEIQVTSAIGGGYSVEVSGYPEVEATGTYYAEAFFKQSGIYADPDSISITIYDSAKNLIANTAMTKKQTGIYNYSYSVGSAPMAGQWETIINATISSTSYYAAEFWKVVGALFDIGTIEIVNSDIDNLNISVIAKNVGNNPTDLSLSWNLTRIDTDELLDSGMETFAVGATPITKYISPSTSYIGQVQITFIGYYLDTEKAGAYKTFSTTSSGSTSCGDGTCNGAETCSTCPSDCGACSSEGTGSGGGSTTAPIVQQEYSLELIDFEKIIYLTKNLEKIITIKINNTGSTDITNIIAILETLNEEYYTIFPSSINTLGPKEIAEFQIKFMVADFTGEKEALLKITSNEINLTEQITINVLSMKDYFISELKRLTEKIQKLKEQLLNAEENELIKDLSTCEIILKNLETDIEKEEFINAKDNLKGTEDCIKNVEDKFSKLKAQPTETKMAESLFWIITWVLIILLIAVIIAVIYILLKKLNLISLIRQTQTTPPTQTNEITKRKLISDKLKDIKERLG